MQLLQSHYLNQRLEEHFKGLQLPQTDIVLSREAIIEALRNKGALQPSEAPEGDNIFPWPFGSTNDQSAPLYLTHTNIRFLYIYTTDTFEKCGMYLTMGILAIYPCANEDPNTLADEIIRIDTQLIPQWIEDFNNLPAEELADLTLKTFYAQCRTIRNQPVIIDSFAAQIYDVSVTDIRQAISRNRNLLSEDKAFHITYEEHLDWYTPIGSTNKVRKSDYRPYVLTPTGLLLLSLRVNSPLAIKVNIGIIRMVSSKVSIFELLKQINNSKQ